MQVGDAQCHEVGDAQCHLHAAGMRWSMARRLASGYGLHAAVALYW
jgi:Ser/Thr protein kinase RdoA (MazF antagonist)